MTYDELKQQAQDYLVTDEAAFMDNFDTFVEAVENRIYTDPDAQFPATRKNVTGSCEAGNRFLSLPPDFLSVFSLAMYDAAVNDHQYLLLRDVNLIREIYPNPTYKALPKLFGVFDKDTLILGPTPDKAYQVELHYHYYPQTLVTAGTTWLSENFPSVMLYGVLAEGYRFQKGDAAQQKVYDDQYMQALMQLKRYSGARIRTDAYANNLAKPTTNVGE